MADDRISRLSQRFRTHATGRKPTSNRVRERQSLYLDAELMGRVDQTHKEVSHQLYPVRVGKATFLEALLEYGMAHLDEVKQGLKQGSETQVNEE
jgi:hypothetical protein